MIIESPLELIFRDLFYRLRAFAGGNDVFLKLEGFSVTGSIKGLIEEFEQRGIVKPHESVIVESSSGNLGLALSLVCAIKGYKFICVTDPTANRATKRGIELYGAKVVIVDDRDRAGGYLESRLKKIDQILQSEPNAVWLNQYANIANKNVHAEQTANEIAREFDKVDWVFVGTGTTGTLAGISEGLRQEFSMIKVVAVEPAGSVTFGGAPGKRNIPGIGTSVRPKLADRGSKVVRRGNCATQLLQQFCPMVKKMSGFLNPKYVNFKREALTLFRRIRGRSFSLRTSERAV